MCRRRILNWPGGPGGSEIVPGSGKFEPPSITVYSADIVGNMRPDADHHRDRRPGSNRPTGVAFDAERQELYVADEIAHTVSVFSANAQGDVAPIRVLKGPKTMMKIPSDVFLDHVNNEMWVASFGNHLALAYKLGASGDTAPVRIIRGSPLNTPGAMISNPFAVAYDTKREEILVTSCVANPRIGAFPRTADKNALPVRTIQGANTKTNRTMHAISYDEVNDEIVVPSRAGQAIMTFRGARERRRGADPHHPGTEDRPAAVRQAVGGSGQRRSVRLLRQLGGVLRPQGQRRRGAEADPEPVRTCGRSRRASIRSATC